MKRNTPLARGTSQLKRTRLKPVSAKRSKLNAARREVVAEVVRKRGFCAWPDCNRLGHHPHEIWTRARASDIEHALLCEQNIVMLCDIHHSRVHTEEDSDEVRASGLIRRSYEGCPCGWPEKPATGSGRIEHQ